MSIHLFGVRHHGPGSARSLKAALEELKPDIVLVEGPPDAQHLLPLLTHSEMQPPVALLIYSPEELSQAVYYPFTHFSPEWQALEYALRNEVPARFMDLPQAYQLSQRIQEAAKATSESNPAPEAAPTDPGAPGQQKEPDKAQKTSEERIENDPQEHPFILLGRASGYSDYERWWERQVELRQNTYDLFEGIQEAMTTVRGDAPPENEHEAQREAYMRQTIRAAEKEGFQRIAVVCGAWHAPALTNLNTAKADTALLKNLKKVKIEATWIPWTNSRLALRSGYGAGITSPGWYEHLWREPEQTTIRWLTYAARLLREEGMDTSSANVIEAVRLSETLAALRDQPTPGLDELHEAIETVLCNGDSTRMKLIRTRLEIGEKQGEVPPDAPSVPLQRDLESLQRRLRLKPSPEEKKLDLDLRNETDRERSQMLHRLALLRISWGKPQARSTRNSTFHELWSLQWQVEYIIKVIEANLWGNTLESAAGHYAAHLAEASKELPQLTELLDKALLAELTRETIDQILQAIQTRAAVTADIRLLMEALPPLARVSRYGNVRGTRPEQVNPLIDGLFERVLVGLPNACISLDDEAALKIVAGLNLVQQSLNLLDRQEQLDEWQTILRKLIEREAIHGMVRGRSCRLLLEQGVLEEEDLQRLARLALSPAAPTDQAAAWIEGILRGSGILLLHQERLWLALDDWLRRLQPETFTTLLPLLRRTFSEFQPPERRAMGDKVRHLHKKSQAVQTAEEPLEEERAARVLPILAQILG
jgi:hypothetical protein